MVLLAAKELDGILSFGIKMIFLNSQGQLLENQR